MEKKNNAGVAFLNKRKQSDNHPDYTGTVLVDGKEYWFSMWQKESPAAGVYYSMSFRAKEAAQGKGGGYQQNQSYSKPATAKPAPMDTSFLDDDLPF